MGWTGREISLYKVRQAEELEGQDQGISAILTIPLLILLQRTWSSCGPHGFPHYRVELKVGPRFGEVEDHRDKTIINKHTHEEVLTIFRFYGHNNSTMIRALSIQFFSFTRLASAQQI